MDYGFLVDLVVVFGLGLVVVLLFTRLRLPPLVGFLATGVLVGPGGLALVRNEHRVEILAEVGIVVLLFTIGVELSLRQVARIARIVFLGGTLQVLVTGGLATGVALFLGLPRGAAVLTGFIVALSSTAIVMRSLTDRGETLSPHGRVSLGILIFQDLAIVPMMMAVPFLAGRAEGDAGIALTLATAVGMLAAVLVAARWALPRLLRVVVATRSNELFLFCIIVVVLGTAWITSWAGLSLALGAFLAGLLVSESEYSQHALGTVLPFRNAFSSLFFVSVGMLLDVKFLAGAPLTVLGLTAAILAGKGLVAAGVARLLGYPPRVALLVGFLLPQVGEFSFLLIHAGGSAGLVDDALRQLLLAATVLSMAMTPLIAAAAPGLARRLAQSTTPAPPEASAELRDHVIIVGYGLNGKNVARALRHAGMAYLVLELNPDTVRTLRREGTPVLYGDATHPETLLHAGAARARVLVLTVPHAAATREIVTVAKHLNPALHVIVRTRLVEEVEELLRMGADEVVPEEFETSIEIFGRVLRRYLVPRDVVDRITRETRQEGYEMLRAAREQHRPVDGLRRLLADVELEVFRVGEESALRGQTLAETNLRQVTGALILAIHRDHMTTANPPADWRLDLNDVALVLGTPEAIAAAGRLFRGS